MTRSTVHLITALATFSIGYLYLRTAYFTTSTLPFAQEFVLMVMGTIATIAITAALLNKQSEIEFDKEHRVKVFELKTTLYYELIDLIERVISKGEIHKTDLVSLEFLTHKLSTIASEEVLLEYTSFLTEIKKSSLDETITALESEALSSSLARLCVKIRYDLISEDPRAFERLQHIIQGNIEAI